MTEPVQTVDGCRPICICGGGIFMGDHHDRRCSAYGSFSAEKISLPKDTVKDLRAAGFGADALAFPRDDLAFEMLCAFNGISPDQAPRGWGHFPNQSTKDAWTRVADVFRKKLTILLDEYDSVNKTVDMVLEETRDSNVINDVHGLYHSAWSNLRNFAR